MAGENSQNQVQTGQGAVPLKGGSPNSEKQVATRLPRPTGSCDVNKQNQNTKPQTARGRKGSVNHQKQNMQPQTAKFSGQPNSQKNNAKGVSPLATNPNTNNQKNDFPSKSKGVSENGFYE